MILTFIILGTVIAFKTPAYEGPDEPGHVENIEALVNGHWYGMSSTCRTAHLSMDPLLSCQGDEAQEAPLYYLLMAGWQKIVAVPTHPALKGELSPAIYLGSPVEAFVHHSAADHQFLLWLRLPNVALGGLTILLAYFAVRLVTQDPWTPVVAAALVAFLPHFVFLSSTVTNDNLVALLGAVLTYFALRWTKSPSGWTMAGIGLASGLLLTTKISTLPIVLVIITLAWMSGAWDQRVKNAAIGLGAALLASAPYFLQNIVRYGDPLARATTSSYLAKIGGLGVLPGMPYVVHDPLKLIVVQVPQRIVETFWYSSGWGQFHWSWPLGLVITLVFICALAGLIGGRQNTRVLVTLAVIAAASLLSVWLLAFQTNSYSATYAFVGLTAFAGLFALAMERWKPPVRFVLPTAGLVGTVIAIQVDVLAVHWT